MLDQLAGPVIEVASSRLETGSSNKRDDWNRATASQAIGAATGLAGCFRTVDASDAERFIGAIAAILQMFSPDIVQDVCDPRTGLPGRMKWMPSVAEVKEACEARSAEKARHKRFENWGKNDDAEERERMKDQGRLPPPPPEKRPTLDELKAKYGANWGLGELPEPAKTGQRARTKADYIAHPAVGDTLRAFARTLPDGGSWTMPELVGLWRASQPGDARPDQLENGRAPARMIDPAMAAVEAAPIVIDGVTLDQGADF